MRFKFGLLMKYVSLTLFNVITHSFDLTLSSEKCDRDPER